MKNREKKRLVYVNFIILAAAALFYAALASPVSVAAMAGRTASPVYRAASADCVSIQCMVEWNAKAVEGIVAFTEENGIGLTLAVTGEWARSNPELLRRAVLAGNGIGLIFGGFDGDDVRFIEETTGERPLIACFTGDASPRDVGYVSSLGLRAVRCTVDIDSANGSAARIAGRIGDGLGGGTIISAAPTAEFLKALPEIAEKIKNMGLDIVPTHKMLYN